MGRKGIFKISIIMVGIIWVGTSWVFGPGPGINENSFQIDGDGFKNEKITIGINSIEFENNYYAKSTFNYFEDFKNMTIRVSGFSPYFKTAPIAGIQMDFHEFVNPGVYKIDSAVSMVVYFKKDIPTEIYDHYYLFDTNGEINIQKYDKVGGLVEGTFNGTFIKMKYNAFTHLYEETEVEVRITNGKFSTIHMPDFHWDAPISNGNEPADFVEKKKKSNKI